MNEEKRSEVARAFQRLVEVRRECERQVAVAEQEFRDALKMNSVVELTVEMKIPPESGSAHETWTFRISDAEGVGVFETCEIGEPGYASLCRISVLGAKGPADFINAAYEFLLAKKMLVKGEPMVSLNDRIFFFNEVSGRYEVVE